MGLRTYRAKRDFARTAEPRGDKTARRTGDSFVIQKHAASHLHFDFRLELDGVLLSWAVPKGVPTKPGTKALAVRTEDHPLEYGTFEGVIPRGQYGGGTVMLWDRGSWLPDADARAGLRRGKLDFTLAGERLRGRWSLVRMASDDGKGRENWLLIKRTDDAKANAATVAPALDRSVASGRSMAAIGAAGDRQWQSNRDAKKSVVPRREPKTAPRRSRRSRGAEATIATDAIAALPGASAAAQPRRVAPQLATLVDATPNGDDWLHEIKFDGYRLLACRDAGGVRLLTRTGQDWTGHFPTIATALAALPIDRAIVDGEVVVLDGEGRSNFQMLQNLFDTDRLAGGSARNLVYYAFDLPHCGGFDLTRVPLVARKQLLARLLAGFGTQGVVRYSDHVVGNGPLFGRQVCERGLEGVISKRAESRYESRRTKTWVKSKCLQRQELVVGGWTDPSGSRTHFGALLLGVYDATGLRYAGKVGTGFSDASLATLAKRLRSLASDHPPFVDPPRGAEARRSHWVEPSCVVEVAFTGWTDDGRLRHPSFQGARDDKDPRTIRREHAQRPPATQPPPAKPSPKSRMPRTTRTREPDGPVAVAGVTISHHDRVLYPEAKLTKADVARYFERIAEHVLPHVADRPLTVVRCPQGLAGSCFFQKHVAQTLPPPVRQHRVAGDPAPWLGVDDVPGLVTLVQFGVLELHPWNSRADDPERPDRIVIDLDPGPDVERARVAAAARGVRDLLTALGLVSFARTTGGKGLHVVVPIRPQASWDEVKAFSRDLVAALATTAPDDFVLTATKAKRRGRIFLDYLRNARGATAVASYSPRARPGAPVAMPIAWRDVDGDLDPMAFTVLTVPRLLARGADPWRDFFRTKQSLTAAMRAAVGRL